MNRYDIRNLETGKITHSYLGETPLPDQKEWAANGPYEVIVTNIDADVLAAEKLKTDAASRIVQLKGVDFSKIATVQELSAIVKVIAEHLLSQG